MEIRSNAADIYTVRPVTQTASDYRDRKQWGVIMPQGSGASRRRSHDLCGAT